MDERERYLLAQIRSYGVTPQEVNILPSGWRGAYSKQNAKVYIKAGMSTAQRVSTLAHELIHIRRGHDGHQDARTEECVQQQAARLIVSRAQYVFAEHVFDGNVVQIARELDVIPDIVRAYQNTLACVAI